MFLTYCWVSVYSVVIKDDICRRWHHLVFLSGAQRAKLDFEIHTNSQNITILCLCIHGKMPTRNFNTLCFEMNMKCNVKLLARSLRPGSVNVKCEKGWREQMESERLRTENVTFCDSLCFQASLADGLTFLHVKTQASFRVAIEDKSCRFS